MKPETRAKHIQEKQAEQAENASRLQFHAYVDSLAVVDSDGDTVVTWPGGVGQPGEISRFFLAYILAAASDARAGKGYDDMAVELVDNPAASDCRVKWFGFDIRENLRVVAADVMFLNVREPDPEKRLAIPAGLWYHRTFEPHPSLDPVDAIVGTTRLKDVGFEQLCKFLNVVVPLDIVDNALSRARLARELTLKAQMFPVV